MPGSDISAEPFFWMTSQKKKKSSWRFFFRKIFSGQKNVRVTAKQMEKALQSSSLLQFHLGRNSGALYRKSTACKERRKTKRRTEKRSWFQNIQLQLKNPDFRNWISEVLQNRKKVIFFFCSSIKKTKKNWKIFCKRQTGQQKRWQRPKKRIACCFCCESHRKSTLF